MWNSSQVKSKYLECNDNLLAHVPRISWLHDGHQLLHNPYPRQIILHSLNEGARHCQWIIQYLYFNPYSTTSTRKRQILDNCGRKLPLALSCFLVAAMLAILPYGGALYPGLFIIKFLLLTSLQVIAIAPLLADYVDDSTKGLAGGYIQISYGLQTTIFSFVFLQLAESIDLAYISWIASGIALLIAIYSSIFIINAFSKDTRSSLLSSTYSNSGSQVHMNCCQRVLANFVYGCRVSRERKMLIAAFILGIPQRVLDTAYISTISVWVSKYIYNGDIAKISYHNKLLLGVSHVAGIPIGLIFGHLYDKCGELIIVPLVFFLAGSPYIALYFMSDLDSVLAYGLQIFSAVFSLLTNSIAVIIVARHSPPHGAGKVFAFRSFMAGIFSIGYNYLNGWILDQYFNRVVFLLIAALALSVTGMFIGIRLCCKQISEIPKEQELIFLMASEQ